MPDQLPALSDAQREIMELVWLRGELTISEAWRELGQRRDVSRSTVQTLINRLHEKGWLRFRAVGNRHVYSATIPRSQSLGRRVVQFLQSAFEGSPEDMISAMIEYRGLSPEETARIRDMLDRAGGEEEEAR